MNQKENKMGVMPVNKLLLSMSLPMIASMLVSALYNIVDSMFVAQISEDSLTAVSLAFPIQNLMIAVAAGTGVGINALLSRRLGEKDEKKASQAANNGIFLAILSCFAFVLFGIFFSKTFFLSQTKDPYILSNGSIYLSICTIGSIGLFGQFTFEKLLQSTGKTMYTMVTQGLGAIINIILDPILIFGLFGFPKMGVAGAAVATITGQIIALMLAIYFNIHKNHEIKLSIKDFRPNVHIIKCIYAVGVPSIIMQSIGSVMTYGMNQILIAFSSTATAVFGVYFKLQSFIFMPVFGLTNGLIPIVSYNFGAKNKARIIKSIKYSVYYAVGIMLAGLIIFQLIPIPLLKIFNASDTMLSIGTIALRVISLSFVFAGYCIILSSVFQALGNGVLSMIVSIIRQLVVILPVAYLLSLTGNVNLVWWAIPIAELASVTLCTLFFIHTYKKTIKAI